MASKRPSTQSKTCKNESQKLNDLSNTNSNNFISDFNVIYTNADCLTNKINELLVFINSLNSSPCLIIITEVNSKRFSTGVDGNNFKISGYFLHSVNVGVNNKRGILIYAEKHLSVSSIYLDINFEEYLCVELTSESTHELLTVCVFYRSPNSSVSNDLQMFNIISYLCGSCKGKLLLLGDFNFPHINWETFSLNHSNRNSSDFKFLSCIQDNFLSQHISFYTRARNKQKANTLDLIFSNGDFIDFVDNYSPLGKSDHCIIYFNCNISLNTSCNNMKYNYNKGNYDLFNIWLTNYYENSFSNTINDKLHLYRSFGDVDLSIFSIEDIEHIWKIFKEGIITGTEKFVPVYNQNWPKKHNPLPVSVLAAIKEKHRLWKKFIRNKSSQNLSDYKHQRNLVRKHTRKATVSFQYSVASSCKTNSKKFWQYVNSKSKSYSKISNIKDTDDFGNITVVRDDDTKTELFVDYFSTVYNHKCYNLPTIEAKNDVLFSMDNVENVIVYDKLCKINVNKSPGPDKIHSKVLHELRDVICVILTLIFNLSLKLSYLPSDGKYSIVTVLHKKGNKDFVGNYRPISLTCICCKIMESIIRDQLTHHFLLNNLFSNKQYGFIKGRSNVLQLITLMDELSLCLEQGGQVDILYTDFEKAFDKLPHNLLLHKLSLYGLNSNIIAWFKNFLTNRSFSVQINNSVSSIKPVVSGIPQGSVLGPLLFVIYINDLPETCGNNSFLFADDAKLYQHIVDKNDSALLSDSFNKMIDWCNLWGMSLNFSKCKCMAIGCNRSNLINYEYKYRINDETVGIIENVQMFKDLGVMFDSELSFSNHIYNKINVANKMLGIIKRHFINLNKETFLLLYKSLVRSHLEYANSVWYPYKVTLIEDIEKVQRRATKLVHTCSKFSYVERLKFLNLPTLQFRRVRGDMIEVFKILNNIYDTNVSPTLKLVNISRTRGHPQKLEIERCRYNVRKFNFCNRVKNLWNSLPNWLIEANSVNSFKNNFDKYFNSDDCLYYSNTFDFKLPLR